MDIPAEGAPEREEMVAAVAMSIVGHACRCHCRTIACLSRHGREEEGERERRGKGQVIVEKFSRSNLPEMEKRKYLVPCNMPVGQFIFILRSRLHLSPGTALFVFVNNTLPQTAQLMGSVYESYKDEGDGFLYLCYSSEKTFG
ncbi:autophagy-related protein 8D isoform X1 [Oryza sativa Japonica Group]|nr:autophagy-related protein 8D isoform 2 [Oryza sativa Japonica Group]